MTDQADTQSLAAPRMIHRHGAVTRVWHWVNAATFFVMLMSGLAILNAHPRLYWGQYGANHDPAWLEIGAAEDIGYMRIGATTLDTSGLLGTSATKEGVEVRRAFPAWITLPASGDLAMARRWHLTFAWILAPSLAIVALWSLIGGHLWRDLIPERRELRPGHLLRTCRDHALLRFHRHADPGYNALQRLSYLAVLLILLPGMVLSGLAMSPAADAAAPWLFDIFGGRQSARSAHFIAASLLGLFLLVHLVMLLLAGPWNQVRSMITGRYRLPRKDTR